MGIKRGKQGLRWAGAEGGISVAGGARGDRTTPPHPYSHPLQDLENLGQAEGFKPGCCEQDRITQQMSPNSVWVGLQAQHPARGVGVRELMCRKLNDAPQPSLQPCTGSWGQGWSSPAPVSGLAFAPLREPIPSMWLFPWGCFGDLNLPPLPLPGICTSSGGFYWPHPRTSTPPFPTLGVFPDTFTLGVLASKKPEITRNLCLFVLGPQPVLLGSYFLTRSSGITPSGLWGPYVMMRFYLELAACKTRTLSSTVLSL